MRRSLFGVLLMFALVSCQAGNSQTDPPPASIESTVVPEDDSSLDEEQVQVEEQTGQAANTAVPTEPASDGSGAVQREITTVQPYDELGMELLGQLNQWRIRLGLWPFSPCAKLDALAREQALYLSSLPSLPDDLHAGPDGEYPPDRAQATGWPCYNNPAQIAITEIAYAGWGVESAIEWWENSPLHNRSVTNPAFREVGIAAVPHPQGNLFIILLGSCPDTLPVLYEPSTNVLYLTSEWYQWAAGDRIQDVTQYQLLPSPHYPIDDTAWQPWQGAISAPQGLGDHYAVAYTDGTHTAISPVDLAVDIAWLPENLDVKTITVIEDPAVAEAAPAEIAEEATVPPKVPITGTVEGTPDITLVYGQISLSIINNPPGERLDLTGLELAAGEITLPVCAWDTPFLGVPLNNFSVGSCLQTWDFSYDDPGVPELCGLRASAIHLPVPELFWVKAPFDVRQGGVTIATCPQAALQGATTCEVKLP
jgi:uncharacterized protein YkwD